jgi:hypothetical protein
MFLERNALTVDIQRSSHTGNAWGVVDSLHGDGENCMKHNKIEPWDRERKGNWRGTGQRTKLDIAREHIVLQNKILAVHLSHNLF